MNLSTQDLGRSAENDACHYLTQQGLQLIEKNYTCQHGEIDLIMRDKDYTVFVEVRLRQNCDFGSSLESVTPYKQRCIILAAKTYLLERNLYDKVDCRFDVVGIESDFKILWIKNAFEVQYR